MGDGYDSKIVTAKRARKNKKIKVFQLIRLKI